MPAGRAPKFGDSLRRAVRSQPSRHSGAVTPRRPAPARVHSLVLDHSSLKSLKSLTSLTIGRARIAADVHTEARHAIAHLPQREPETRTGRGAVEAVPFERAH